MILFMQYFDTFYTYTIHIDKKMSNKLKLKISIFLQSDGLNL